MPEIKQNFIKGKMNKDLDERLIPKGEYREAQNIHITESEGSDVGAIENVLGNVKVTGTIAPAFDTPGYPTLLDGEGYEVIGYCKDLAKKRVVYFVTNFESTAFVDNIRTIPRAQNAGTSSYSSSINQNCVIVLYDIENKSTSTLVIGPWLNFSKNHLITGAQIIDDLLFWTDNYNQPRKINIQLALDNYIDDSDQYYDCEETVSIAKYAPYAPLITFKSEGTIVAGNADIGIVTTNATGITDGVYNITLGVTSGVTTSGNGDSVAMELTVSSGTVTAVNVTSTGSGFLAGDTITISGTVLTGASNSVVLTIRIEDLNHSQTSSLDNSIESDYLKERFVRFSYRYKYDDGEYSLIAPFTQSIFEPLNSGIITNNDSPTNPDDERNSTADEPQVLTGKKEAYKKGVVDIMQNRINKIEFRIPLPNKDEFKTNSLNYSSYANPFHIKEIEVLLKESDGVSFKIVKTIKIDEITSSDIETYQIAPSGTVYYRQALKYTYSSSEPYKVLPESEVTRVYDQVPLMAKALEVVGNRVVFGNYVENYPYPLDVNNKKGINYSVGTTIKGDTDQSLDLKQWMHKTYKYHTLKQRRTYQVGIVLVDAFGRQSPVILSSNTNNLNADTVTTDPVVSDFSANTNASWSGSRTTYGNSLKITFEDSLLTNDNKFIADMIYGAGYNPHGWFSYRFVVKQTEQEYYNVYAPHPFDGWNNVTENRDDTLTGGRSWLALHGDNVNKVPRSLNDTDLNRDGTMGSNARLYPKVIFDTNGESKMNASYHELAEVISLGTAFEQNLFISGDDNKSGTGGFSIYNFIYGKNKNPLVAELQNMKAYTGSTSNNEVNVLFSDIAVSTASSSIVLSSDQLGTNASFADDTYNGYSVNATSLNLGEDVVVIDSTSSSSTINISSKQTFEEGDKIVLSKYYEGLSVFETEPFESKIDIYYETSSCGLVKDLSEQINIDPATLPSDLRIYQDSGYSFGTGQDPVNNLNEQYGVLAYLYENIEAGTNIGDLSATVNTSPAGTLSFSINKVTREQDGADVSSLFSIVNVSGTYKLQTAGSFVYRNTTFDNLTVSVAVTDSNSGTKYLDIFVKVRNSAPSITAPTGPLSISTIAGADVEVINTDNDLENGGTIIVGTVNKYTGLTITFDFGNSDFNDYFYLDGNAPQGKYILKTSDEWTVSNAEDFFTNSEANRTVTLTVTDAHGLTDTASVLINEYSNVIVSGYLSRANSVNTYCQSYSAAVYYATPGTGDDPIIYGEAPELYNGNILYTDSAITTLAPAGVYISYNTQNTAWIYEVDSSGVVSVYGAFSEYDDC